ncbi:hypothetical protein [Microbacterium sp.]|uniref:hypothetical protein n=1 Tax=Microbacterium sp. TaxID=51671 RepID=UPI003A8BB4CB
MVALAGLGGCSAASDDVVDVATQYMDAISAGEFATAFALTTTDPASIGCAALTSNGQTSGVSEAEVDADSVRVDGDSASIDVSYHALDDVSGRIQLTRTGDRWRVEQGSTDALAVRFRERTVATFSVGSYVSGGERCTVPVVDGEASFPALPGVYSVSVADPTGVTTLKLPGTPPDPSDATTVDVVVAPGSTEPWVLAPPASSAPPPGFAGSSQLRAEFAQVTADGHRCVDGSGRDATCPDEMTTAGRAVVLDEVWTDDDQTWSFAAVQLPDDIPLDDTFGYTDDQVSARYSGVLETSTPAPFTVTFILSGD